MSKLVLHELPPSPNCTKVRIALGFKGIDYESRLVNGQDRTQAVEDYGIPLTPGITGEGFRLYDSHAILRYLDLNYPGPRYLPTDADALREVEQWERWARNESIRGLGGVFGMAFGRQDFDQTALDAARAMLTEDTIKIEEHLADRDWIVGDALSAADICVASRLVLVLPPASVQSAVEAGEFPFWPFFFEHTAVQEDRPRTLDLIERVMAYDGLMAQLGKLAAK
jgi:glutathione S-transferase